MRGKKMRYKCVTGTIDPFWTIDSLKEMGVAMDDLQPYVVCEDGDLVLITGVRPDPTGLLSDGELIADGVDFSCAGDDKSNWPNNGCFTFEDKKTPKNLF